MKKGFTLVELLSVITIISIIAIAAGVSYTKINKEHKKNVCKSLENQLKTSAVEYCQDNSASYYKASECCINIETIRQEQTSYTREEMEKIITSVGYTTAENYFVCVNRSNNSATGFYMPTATNSVDKSTVLSLCD